LDDKIRSTLDGSQVGDARGDAQQGREGLAYVAAAC
jgi:hypothetical protein